MSSLLFPDNWAQRQEKELQRRFNRIVYTYDFVGCCVSLEGQDITEMIRLEREITYLTFQKWFPEEVKAFAEVFGYEKHASKGLTIKHDHHVGFFKSKYQGRECYFIRHSAIEWIWVRPIPSWQKKRRKK